jgi:molecular chaperone GrpE (heat shock protein)
MSATIVTLINKPPSYAKTENQALCGYQWGCKVVVNKPKTIFKTNGIQVFESKKTSKTFDPEMHKCVNIRQIA